MSGFFVIFVTLTKYKHLKRKYNEEADKLSKNAAKNENNLFEE